MNDDNTEYDPAEGGVGYLTWDEFDRLGRAVKNAHKHVAWWRIAGHIKLGDSEEHRPRSSDPTIPLPATWLAAEEISRLLGELNGWPTLEDAANTLDGQFFATLLIREVETAMAKWPMSDRPHKVRFLRCRACQQQTLKYYPPNRGERRDADHVFPQMRYQDGAVRETPEPDLRPVLERGRTVYIPVEHPATVGRTALLDVTVKCTNPECRAVEDPAMFERDALLIRLEAERGSGKRLDTAGGRPSEGEQIQADDLPVGA